MPLDKDLLCKGAAAAFKSLDESIVTVAFYIMISVLAICIVWFMNGNKK